MSAPSLRDDDAWLRMAFLALPARRARALLRHFGEPRSVFEAVQAGRNDDLLHVPGITPKVIERLQEVAEFDTSKAVRAMEEHAIRLLLPGDDEFPPGLSEDGALAEDAPPLLFVRGSVLPQDRRAVAIVGTRAASEYGRSLAERLAGDLARASVTVVSGLARGIDTIAHKGALEAGGRTFAVCGCGLDVAYPTENRELMGRIAQQGALFSEWAPTTHPEAWHFPTRNRIIAALSLGVVVVEASQKSGSLITADCALEQGREVFAVPGNVMRPGSRGPHSLIRQGATLVESAEQIVEALNSRVMPLGEAFTPPNRSTAAFERTPAKQDGEAVASSGAAAKKAETVPSSAPSSTDLTPEQNAVYTATDEEPRHLDDIAARANMGAAQAAATLVVLELRGLARRHAGGLFSRTF